MANSFDRLKELNLSRDEVNRIGEALKNDEFKKLLADYVEEIQDPKNRQIYEDEVKEIERERGQEVTFLHPTPGYVIKTSINGTQKGFINVCSNDNIDKPSSSPTFQDGARGLQWSLPHSLAPPHEDLDNKGVRCQVYDVLFHPDTLHLASKSTAFRLVLNNTALETVEKNFNVELDKKNLKFPKMTYKGVKRATILRKASKIKPSEKTPEEQEMFDRIYSEIDEQRSKNVHTPSPRKSKPRRNSNSEFSTYTTPKYLIKHRSHVDMQDFTENRDAKLNVAIPKELIIEIDLPLLKSSGDMNLDVTEKTVQVISEKPAKYKLNLTLPYHVNESGGTAKFDKDLKKLMVTLPVRRKNSYELNRYDSGVESDPNCPGTPESEEEIEIVIENSDKPCDEVVKNGSGEDRTKVSDDFLDASDLYNLPEYTCNVFDNVVAFTFNVKNVDDKTVEKRLSREESLIKVKFTSISPSFYPTCYAFYVKFYQHKFIEEDVSIETWDNNVILQVPLLASEVEFKSYFCGLNQDDLKEKYIEEPAIINKVLEETEDEVKSQSDSSANTSPVHENRNSVTEETNKKVQSRAIDIMAMSYESSGDELSASSFSPRKSKGILKRISHNRSKFGRSVSESSLDDFVSSSYETCHHGSIDCVPEDVKEEDEEHMSCSLKKTVRFNDVIMKQLFRSNSSILGQKKKNQRKARNKKRAQERRYSESEASDVETSKKEGDIQTNDRSGFRGESREKSMDYKKDDGDIFHFEMSN